MGTHRDEVVRARELMIDRQIAARGVVDPAVLAAMRSVPRERFVRERDVADAHGDTPLPIGHGQTISQPYVVAWMAEAAEIKATDRVLEIGTGSGYGAAVLGYLAQQVWTVERISSLATAARELLTDLGCTNIGVVNADGTLGLPDRAPFNAIVVTAGGLYVPRTLVDQLADDGRMVIPVGDVADHQRLVRVRRHMRQVTEEELGRVRFVPLIGKHGWMQT